MSKQLVPEGQEWKLGVKEGIEQVLGEKAVAFDFRVSEPAHCGVFVDFISGIDFTRLQNKLRYPCNAEACSLVMGKKKYLAVMILITKE